MNPVTGVDHPATEDVRRLHASLTVVDLHADALLWKRDLNRRNAFGHVDVPRLRDGNVALQAFTLVTKVPRSQNYAANDSTSDRITLAAVLQRWPIRTWRSPLERALHQAHTLQRQAARSDGRLRLVRTATDLDRVLRERGKGDGPIGALLGIEGAHALEGRLDALDTLFAAGIRMVGLAHFHDNRVAGSAHGRVKSGLTALGTEVVRRSEALGMTVDLSHASPATIDDVLAIATRPVVVSHTGVIGTCPGARNLSDAQLQGIAATGGVVGIGFWPDAVCGDTPSHIAAAVLHVIEQAGPEHVALGSDFDGTVPVPFDVGGMAQVTQALVDAGVDEATIRKVMGDNAVRVFRKTLPPGGR